MAEPPTGDDDSTANEVRRLATRWAVMSQVGMELFGPVLLGLLIDYAFGSMPWATVIGAVLGMLVGFVHLAQIAKRMGGPDAGEGPTGRGGP